MKDFHQVQKDRVKYHALPNKNTVHRSSLIVPNISHSEAWIGFINHFLIKRGYKSVALKISAINKIGYLLDALTIEINEPKVYSFNLTKMFSKFNPTNYLIEFFSEKNLFIPFPAVIINHFGKDFCNVVHSYNRILNDVFENDQINKTQVSEASFDLDINNKYDTFFNFSTGMSDVNNSSLFLSYEKNKEKIKKEIKISLPRLSYKSFYLSKIFSKELNNNVNKLNGGVVRIKQPKQNLFFGRLLAGIINKKTKAFSANHTYYDSTKKTEYFSLPNSFRTYPFFKNFVNKVTMYPIFSPSKLTIYLKIYNKKGTFISKKFKFLSTSSFPLSINVNDFVESENLQDVTAFTLVADGSEGRIPTRVNHQLIYGELSDKNSLKCSINVSLINKRVFVPKKKKGFIWGQFINHKDYNSKIGFCFNSSEGKSDLINIDFYSSTGKLKSKKKVLNPKKSLIFNASELLGSFKKLELNWYVAKCIRPDLTAYSVHTHQLSGNSSGEHNF